MADLKLPPGPGNEVPADVGTVGVNLARYQGLPNDRVARSFREMKAKPAFTTASKAFVQGD